MQKMTKKRATKYVNNIIQQQQPCYYTIYNNDDNNKGNMANQHLLIKTATTRTRLCVSNMYMMYKTTTTAPDKIHYQWSHM
mmetsp:Transcript_6575/g.10651  ORF Transcript_6575/g.10651 Transcript_6575/m.10651 type:complete len:81 (-) Transcript_6575:600-842(-)